jgi:signal peptidase I
MRGRLRRGLGALLAVAVLAAAWYFLAPTELGGRTSYAITFGVSMEPHFHRGDLVVLRARPSYSVGDVVAYRSADLHRNVLHRIVAVHDGRYTFKGDNNNFLDPERPTEAAFVGSEWLHVPRAGTWLAALHRPRNAAIVSGVAVLLLLLSGGGTAVHRSRRRRAPQEPREDKPRQRRQPSGGLGGAGFVVAALGAGALIAAAALGVAALRQPLERSLVWANLYVNHGRFSYAAPVKRGATYQATVVRSGDPVYLHLVHRLPLAFAYKLDATRPGPLSGTAELEAWLRDDEGWSHRIVLAPTQSFAGRKVTLHGVLDLTRFERVISTFERETGEHNTLYHLSVDAHVHVHGTVASRPVSTTFAPSLAFNLDQLRLAVVQPVASTDPSAPPATNSLEQSAGGAGTRVETNSLHAFGRSVTVARARRLATLLGIAGLVLAAIGGLLMLLARRDHEVETIRRRYEDWIVDVMPRDRPAGSERRVASMDALARLAEQYDRLILHERRDEGDAFLVEDDGIAYTYLVRNLDRHLAVAQ